MKVLKFGAIWCTECLVMRPMWEEIEQKFPTLITEYFDADENADVLKKYAINEIPSFIFLNDAKEVVSILKGVQNKHKLIKEIEIFLSKNK